MDFHICFSRSDFTICIVFFKLKTAYEMRISDWSSDVCSSDLHAWVNCPDEGALALVRKYPAGRLVVDRTEESWFKRKSNEGPTQIGRASCRERVCQYV